MAVQRFFVREEHDSVCVVAAVRQCRLGTQKVEHSHQSTEGGFLSIATGPAIREDSPGLELVPSALWESKWRVLCKRALDVTIAASALVLFAPLMASVAILIKVTSPGPVLFRWKVVGKNGKPLKAFKFRSMYSEAENDKIKLQSQNEMRGPVFKMANDPRVTKVGRWVRKFSVDELPQLWSVLRGDLSLVGPRPPLQSEYVLFSEWQRSKLTVKPGITCLWQVGGRNRISDFDDWVRLDLEYIRNWSLWLDFKILIRTVPAVILGEGR